MTQALSKNLRRGCRNVLPFVVIIAATGWLIGPLLLRMNSSLPTGPNQLTTVPLFNAWTIWWNSDRLLHGFAGYWQAPIFFPAKDAFAYSEPQSITALLAPLVWLTRSPAVAYNVYLMVSLLLNGAAGYLVAGRIGLGRPASTACGIMMLWLPIGLRQADVLQTVPIWPLLWTWDAMRRHGRNPSARTGVECAAAYAVAFHTCIHHTLFLTVVLVATGWMLVRSRSTRSVLQFGLVAVLLAAVAIAPTALSLKAALNGDDFERTPDLVRNLSAKPWSLWLVPADGWLKFSARPGFGLSPGWTKILLSVIGIGLGFRRRRHRRWICFLTTTAVVAGILATGPNFSVGGWEPWQMPAESFPGMKNVRNVFRFVYLMQMAVILLTTIGLRELQLRCRRLSGRRRVGMTAVAVVLGITAVIEIPPPRLHHIGFPDLQRHRAWTDFLKHNTPPGRAIACIPFAPGTQAPDFDSTTRWMLYGTLHRIPMVNGYSGFFPQHYMDLRKHVADNGLTDKVLDELAGMQVEFVVVNHRSPDADKQFHNSTRLQPTFRDPIGISVYRLLPHKSAAP
ncbi:MAG: hypothetical protein KDA89_13315 [Planctomycetaceae bacterium]|nr:hypothetical protein [Planctomycetaceae bacterium]